LHTCAVKLDGGLWCWGGGASGQLGLGSNTNQVSPTQVGAATWTTVSAGMAYTCGVQSAGTLWCWGANEHSQLGNGGTTGRRSPVRIAGQSLVSIATDATHTCGRHQDGTLWCWGDNANGELGDGTTGNAQKLPKQTVGALCGKVPICGNGGDPEQGEECDDGNNTNGDGCSFDCRNERCFGVVCNGSDQCHGVCNPATGECTDEQKPDGTDCSDDNACTQTDKCLNGACIGANEVQCPGPSNPTCYGPGVCDPKDGTCSNPPIENVQCSITLRMDGTVAKGDTEGNLTAIFGYDSTGTKPIHPGVNRITIDGTDVTSQVRPPTYLLPNKHPGAMLVTFAPGQTVKWTVDTKEITASGTTPTRQAVPDGNGTKVDIGGGVSIPIVPNTQPYSEKPEKITAKTPPSVGAAFNGVLSGELTVSPTGAAVYTLPIAIPPGIGGAAPNLNLVYNSQGLDGIAGQGWSLTGLSIIHRCPKTRMQDGYAKPIEMDSSGIDETDGDGVCLDGKRLFIAKKDGQRTYFETEFTEFSSISYYKPDGFQVITKAGEIRDYLLPGELIAEEGGRAGTAS